MYVWSTKHPNLDSILLIKVIREFTNTAYNNIYMKRCKNNKSWYFNMWHMCSPRAVCILMCAHDKHSRYIDAHGCGSVLWSRGVRGLCNLNFSVARIMLYSHSLSGGARLYMPSPFAVRFANARGASIKRTHDWDTINRNKPNEHARMCKGGCLEVDGANIC